MNISLIDNFESCGRGKIMQTSNNLELAKTYSRKELQRQFEINDATLFTGIFQPKGHSSIWLFVTKHKTPDRIDYYDDFDGQVLLFEGQRTGKTDGKIINHIADGNELLVFYRRKKDEHTGYAFKYLGRFEYVSHIGNGPKHFLLQALDLTRSDDDRLTETERQMSIIDLIEGKERSRVQTYIERNPRLRAEALRLHGTRCTACGFDFGEKYGCLGEGYVEVHHLFPISEYGGERKVNPTTDLVPLCSNCHRIIHRPEKVLSIEELKRIIAGKERRD